MFKDKAGDRILGLLALAEQRNTDVKGKGGLVDNPFDSLDLVRGEGGAVGDELDKSIYNTAPGSKPSDKDLKDIRRILEGLGGVKKADSSWFNEGTGIEPEGFDSVPDYLKNKLREKQWKDELKKNQDAGLEVTPVSDQTFRDPVAEDPELYQLLKEIGVDMSPWDNEPPATIQERMIREGYTMSDLV